MRKHHRQHGLAPAGHFGRLKYIILIFIIRAAGNAYLLDGLTDVAHTAGLHQMAHGEDLFVILRQNAFVYDQIIFKHDTNNSF